MEIIFLVNKIQCIFLKVSENVKVDSFQHRGKRTRKHEDNLKGKLESSFLSFLMN